MPSPAARNTKDTPCGVVQHEAGFGTDEEALTMSKWISGIEQASGLSVFSVGQQDAARGAGLNDLGVISMTVLVEVHRRPERIPVIRRGGVDAATSDHLVCDRFPFERACVIYRRGDL
jgi:hypothetical protein